MNILPIQITEEGILIPKVYIAALGELELVVTEEFVLLRPKPTTATFVVTDDSAPKYDYDFIGIGHTRDPQASVNAEEILEREIKRESGWSLE